MLTLYQDQNLANVREDTQKALINTRKDRTNPTTDRVENNRVKIYQENLFPTKIFIADDVLEKKHIDVMKKDTIKLTKLHPYGLNNSKSNWQSHTNLHHEKIYQPLVEKIKLTTEKYFFKMSWKVKKYKITSMWSNILKPNEMNRPHTHCNTILSGVYYLESNPQAPPIHFYDPRAQAKVLIPKFTQNTIENSDIWTYPSIVNRMLVFPSWLEHYVPVNNSNKNRISLSWDIVLTIS